MSRSRAIRRVLPAVLPRNGFVGVVKYSGIRDLVVHVEPHGDPHS